MMAIFAVAIPTIASNSIKCYTFRTKKLHNGPDILILLIVKLFSSISRLLENFFPFSIVNCVSHFGVTMTDMG